LHQVAINDFAKAMMWPELVPTLKAAIRDSDVMINTKPSRFKTINVLLCLQQIIKPFRYSMDPMVALEPVPDQLELICKELLAPLHDMFHRLVQQVMQPGLLPFISSVQLLLSALLVLFVFRMFFFFFAMTCSRKPY
jgi:hypothetical protein